LDHLPLPWHHLEGLGDVLAEFDQLAAAAGAGRRRRHDHALTRQVSQQRASHGPLAVEAAHRGGFRFSRPSGNRVFCGTGFQLLELQFQLVEQLAAALGRLPKPRFSPSWTCNAKLFMPRRMSMWPIASHTRTPEGTAIIAPITL
jgi:hypothetical protein